MSINFIEELRWRGMLHDIMPGTEEFLLKNKTSAYIGFDPTASSLHIGNLAAIMLLKQFQLAGHKPIALVGGATGMIGDPSGKAAEREFLSEEVLRFNQNAIKNQLAHFLQFDNSPTGAEIVNNYDWFKDFSFLGFLREAGKFLSVNYMISKDSVQKRLESGISFTEFSYQLLQGYDFYWLYKNKNVRLQMGGSDQWGNITTGTEIIRRKEFAENNVNLEEDTKAFALTTPLITKSDGSKFGKSESGNVWLDPTLTSPFQFYQFWLNTADADCVRFLKVFTLLNQGQIENLEIEHNKAPHLRIMQKTLAKEVTTLVHSSENWEKSVLISEFLYGKGGLDSIKDLPIETLESLFNDIPNSKVSKDLIEENPTILDLISVHTNSEIYNSKGEARRALQGNAISINKVKLLDDGTLSSFELIQDKYLLISKGKKYHVITFN
jgi:tyrosyl-tRNA synthetase